jgi:hypothetical protein
LNFQQATAHDALSVKLDKLLVTASRTKCPTSNEEDKNKVQLIIVSHVGKANVSVCKKFESQTFFSSTTICDASRNCCLSRNLGTARSSSDASSLASNQLYEKVPYLQLIRCLLLPPTICLFHQNQPDQQVSLLNQRLRSQLNEQNGLPR